MSCVSVYESDLIHSPKIGICVYNEDITVLSSSKELTMSLNNAQQTAAQVTETRAALAKQGRRKGLAESVRKDMIADAQRGKGHDKPLQLR